MCVNEARQNDEPRTFVVYIRQDPCTGFVDGEHRNKSTVIDCNGQPGYGGDGRLDANCIECLKQRIDSLRLGSGLSFCCNELALQYSPRMRLKAVESGAAVVEFPR
jgi:hypothetical protein